jgi:hypothetical protein
MWSILKRAFNNKAYRLEKMLRRFEATQMGRDLLAFAHQQGIVFDMQENLDATAMYEAPPINRITLSADQPDELHLINLAHELRHVWQHQRIGDLHDKTLSPEGEVAVLRHIEADAWAYSHAFMEDFEKNTGDAGPREAYRFFTVRRGMSVSKIHDASYAEKVILYVSEIGHCFGNYDVRACHTAIEGKKNGDAALLSPEDERQRIVDILRSFDMPWGHVPAPFSGLLDSDFLSFERVTLKNENTVLLQQASAAFKSGRL